MWIPPRFLSFLAGLFLIGGRCCAEEVRGRIESSSIEVKLVPDKATIMLGEPVFLSFIVTNKTAEDLTVIVGGDYQNGMGRPDTFEVTTHAADGHEVVQPTAGQNMGGISGPERIPVSGTYSFRLFLPHWAKIDRVGRYMITAKRVLNMGKPNQSGRDPYRTDILGEAQTKIEVVPLDTAALGAMIKVLGNQLLTQRHYEPAEPGTALKEIHDERVIPQFLKALRTDDYELKYMALDAFSSFGSEQALGGLLEGMKTTGRDIGGSSTAEGANQLAENIRYAAAIGLSKSPNPAALRLLLDHKEDSSYAVRMLVAQVLGTRFRKEEALPLLQEMTKDSDQRVSDQAHRYVDLLSKSEEPANR